MKKSLEKILLAHHYWNIHVLVIFAVLNLLLPACSSKNHTANYRKNKTSELIDKVSPEKIGSI